MIKVHLPDIIGAGYGAFWRSKHFYRVIKGGRGSKKSCTVAIELIKNIIKHPGANALVIRRFYNKHRNSTFAQLRWAINRLGVGYAFKCKQGQLEIIYKPTGQKILFAGLDDPESLKGITVESGYLCWVWIEEAQQVPTWEVFNTVALSIRGEVPEGLYKQMTLTMNPVNEKHWIKPKFFDVAQDDILAITTTYKCNEWLDDQDRQRIEALPPSQYRVDGLGEWGVTEGLIYEQFVECNKDFHILLDELPRFQSVNIGIDWGDNTSAHSFTATGITQGYQDVIVLRSEKHNAAGMAFEALIEKAVQFVVNVVSRHGPVSLIFCDHVNTYMRSLSNALIAKGIKTTVTHAYKGIIFDRIEITRKLLAMGRLKFLKGQCQSLENALNNAAWDSKKPKTRLDDGTVDVDSLDSFEYSWSRFIDVFANSFKVGGI